MQVAFDGRLAEVRALLDAGVPVDAPGPGWNPLHAAIENGETECVRLLLDRGADLHESAMGMTPLVHAVDVAIDGTIQTGGDQGDEPVGLVQLLLDRGADPRPGVPVAAAYKSRKLLDLLRSAVEAD